MKIIYILLCFSIFFLTSINSNASDVSNEVIMINNMYLIICSAMVMIMTPGLALFYAGMVRNQNLFITMMHSFIKLSVVTITWFIIGYTIAFGDSFLGLFGSFSKLFLNNITIDSISKYANVTEYIYIAFQGMFAVITCAIITGSFAERVKLLPVIIFASLWTILVYAPIAHWIWGGGFIYQKFHPLDFAGGTVVHINSAIAGLVAAIFIGKRKANLDNNSNNKSLHLTIFGAGILWFGWFGFNAGSGFTPNNVACIAFLNTNICAAAGAMSWLILEYVLYKKVDIVGVINGAVAGLVAITPACGYVDLQYGFIIGIVAGILCYWAVYYIKPKFGYDDTLDVFGIHGMAGLWGAIATSLFASKSINQNGMDGLIYGNYMLLFDQIISILIVVGYSATATYVILRIINYFNPIRASEEEEKIGLDMSNI